MYYNLEAWDLKPAIRSGIRSDLIRKNGYPGSPDPADLDNEILGSGILIRIMTCNIFKI